MVSQTQIWKVNRETCTNKSRSSAIHTPVIHMPLSASAHTSSVRISSQLFSLGSNIYIGLYISFVLMISASSLFSKAMQSTRLVTSWRGRKISMSSNQRHQLMKVPLLPSAMHVLVFCIVISEVARFCCFFVRSPRAVGAAQDFWLPCGWRQLEAG